MRSNRISQLTDVKKNEHQSVIDSTASVSELTVAAPAYLYALIWLLYFAINFLKHAPFGCDQQPQALHQRSAITLSRHSQPSKQVLTVTNEDLRVLCRREMAHAFHRLVLAASDLLASRLAHLRRVAPVVLARQHVHGTLLGVDAGYAAAAVPSTCENFQLRFCLT
jgi:hypothetical protein